MKPTMSRSVRPGNTRSAFLGRPWIVAGVAVFAVLLAQGQTTPLPALSNQAVPLT